MLICAPVDRTWTIFYRNQIRKKTVDTACKVGEIDIVVGVVGSEQRLPTKRVGLSELLGFSVYFCRIV